MARDVGAGGGAAVEGTDFGEGEGVDGAAVELQVVVNNELIVLGDDDIEFEDVGADGEGVFEGGEGVFGAECAATAVTEDEGFGGEG